MGDRDYDVGFGKPPKHSQFPPGTSGNKGRTKKLPESHKEIVARIRDEVVEIGGKSITKFELAVRSVMNSTIKAGKPKDLVALLQVMEKYGALPERDLRAEAQAAGDAVMRKILKIFDRTNGVDPADSEAVERNGKEEARIILACPQCGPAMRERWRNPEHQALKKRHGATGLQNQIDRSFAKGD